MWNIRKLVKKGDYLYAVIPEHPNASDHGYVLAHRAIMENEIGRLLRDDEVVHHINKDGKDNGIENLELMDSRDHVSFHLKQKGKNLVDLVCPWCKRKFTKAKKQTFLQKGGEWSSCSPSCRGKFSSRIQHGGKTPEIEAAILNNVVREYHSFD